MNQIIHKYFIDGKINGAIYNYMNKVASHNNDAMLFDAHINAINELNLLNENDCQKYFDIYAYVSSSIKYITGKVNEGVAISICKFGFDNKNDYDFTKTYHIDKMFLDFLIKNKHLLKRAYPNNMGVEGTDEPNPQYNVEKWVETMRYIYQAANTNNLPLDKISQQATSTWDESERVHFNRWMKYYQEGNHSKYNVKTAQFFTPQKKEETPNLSGIDSVFNSTFTPDPIAEKKKRIDDARKKLRSRLKSILELLDQYRDVLPRQDSDAMRKDVFDLHERIWNLEYKQSMVDSIMRTHNQFVKRGFIEGAAELKKIAQEVAADKIPEPQALPIEQKEVSAPTASPPDIDPSIQATIPDTEEIIEEMAPPVQKKEDATELNVDVIEIPDFSTASHRDALITLEKANQILADRGVVRALAAVDIILASLGIASHFPGLGESMSKLMESFHYAETRIAAVISQLRGSSGPNMVDRDKEKDKPASTPKEDTIETREEVEKPVGEIIAGPPDTEMPSTEMPSTEVPSTEPPAPPVMK